MTRWSCRRRLHGRVFAGRPRVRLGDASPGGRLRLDALARYLQDVSNDDTRDGGLDDDGWVVRRTAARSSSVPVIGEELVAADVLQRDRRAVGRAAGALRGDRGGAVDAVSLWVHVDLATGRPAPLTPRFFDALRRGRRRPHRAGPAVPPRPAGRWRRVARGPCGPPTST